MLTYVLAADGSPLMPTYNISKVRRMLKDGRAVIAGHKPGFTIRLTYALPDQKTPHTQKIELCEDTGYQHIGVSVKSKKHEYVHLQVDTLADEKNHHDAQRRYRRNRRNRLRYRAPRFDNRTHSKKPGWIAPSLQHKADIHVRLVSTFQKVLPICDVYLEVGTFDTQVLEAKEKGLPIPEGSDYQHGTRYGIATLREAVFYRDGYKCQCCGKGIKDGRILRVHRPDGQPDHGMHEMPYSGKPQKRREAIWLEAKDDASDWRCIHEHREVENCAGCQRLGFQSDCACHIWSGYQIIAPGSLHYQDACE